MAGLTAKVLWRCLAMDRRDSPTLPTRFPDISYIWLRRSPCVALFRRKLLTPFDKLNPGRTGRWALESFWECLAEEQLVLSNMDMWNS